MDWVVKALEKIDSTLQQYGWDETSSQSYTYISRSKINGVKVGLEVNLLNFHGSTLERNSSVNRRIGYSIELTCSNSTNKIFTKVCEVFEDILKDYKKHKFLNSPSEVEVFLKRIQDLGIFLESNFIEV